MHLIHHWSTEFRCSIFPQQATVRPNSGKAPISRSEPSRKSATKIGAGKRPPIRWATQSDDIHSDLTVAMVAYEENNPSDCRSRTHLGSASLGFDHPLKPAASPPETQIDEQGNKSAQQISHPFMTSSRSLTSRSKQKLQSLIRSRSIVNFSRDSS
ncbi:hypothetical protein ACLOJK_004140 [Asimina triloba]